MKQYYECHITITSFSERAFIEKDRITAQLSVEINGWTWSEIKGDPDLGPGVKWYATKHFNTRKQMKTVVAAVDSLGRALAFSGLKVLRRKVELVVHDERTPDGWAGV